MATINVEVIISAIDRASSTLKGFQNNAKSVHEGFADMVKASTAASIAFAAALTLTGKSIIDVASSMQQSKVAFTTMLGSSEAATKSLKELSDFARVTPFTFPSIVDGAKRLLAYNLSAEELIPTLKMLGNVASGVGMDKMPQLILAFGQVKAATVLTGMELRQFSETGVPLLGALAEKAGVTAGQMKEMISAGSVTFEQVNEVLKEMTSEGGKFFDLMDKQSKTFAGITSNISDQLIRIGFNIAGISTEAETFGDVIAGGPFDLLAQGADKVLVALNAVEPQIKGFITAFISNGPLVAAVIGAIAGGLLGATVALFSFLAPFIALVAIGAAVAAAITLVIQNFEQLSPWIYGITASLAALGIVILASVIPAFVAWATAAIAAAAATIVALLPIIIPIVAIGAAVTALTFAWRNNWGSIREMTDNVVAFFRGTVMPFFENGFGKRLVEIIGFVVSHFVPGFQAMKMIVEGVIGAISSLINKAQELASKITGGLRIPHFQSGGVVPGPIGAPQMAVVHGGEEVIPADGRSSGGGGGSGVSLNVNVGIYAGTEMEKRNIARELYAGLVQLAQAENKNVSEMMGG